jgi:hypothetical protein
MGHHFNPNNLDLPSPRTDNDRAKWRREQQDEIIAEAQKPIAEAFEGFAPTQTTTHETLESWLTVLADWREKGFAAQEASDPRLRMLGFGGITHPECHQVSLKAVKEGAGIVPLALAEQLGFTPEMISQLLQSTRGREQLLGGLELVYDPNGVTDPHMEQDFLDLCVTLQAEAEKEAPLNDGELTIARPIPREIELKIAPTRVKKVGITMNMEIEIAGEILSTVASFDMDPETFGLDQQIEVHEWQDANGKRVEMSPSPILEVSLRGRMIRCKVEN